MALRELVGLVTRAALGEPVPAGVRGAAQRATLETPRVSQLAEVQLPDVGRLPVHHHRTAPPVLVENGEHRPDPRRRVDHDPVAKRARKADELEHSRAAAGEDRQRAPSLHLCSCDPLDPHRCPHAATSVRRGRASRRWRESGSGAGGCLPSCGASAEHPAPDVRPGRPTRPEALRRAGGRSDRACVRWARAPPARSLAQAPRACRPWLRSAARTSHLGR